MSGVRGRLDGARSPADADWSRQLAGDATYGRKGDIVKTPDTADRRVEHSQQNGYTSRAGSSFHEVCASAGGQARRRTPRFGHRSPRQPSVELS